MKKNKGFTIVELVVVIAIMAVLTAGSAISFGIVTGSKVKSAAKEVKSTLTDVQLATMSKKDTYAAVLVKSGDKQFIQTGTVKSDGSFNKKTEKELDDRTEITVNINGVDQSLSSSNGVMITNNKSTGSFRTTTNIAGTSLGGVCKKITLKRGSRTIVITLHTSTGKISIEY